jgi:carnosine N-methyltransferase
LSVIALSLISDLSCVAVSGPLLYHWSEMPGELSIELSWEELKRVIESFGFVIEVRARVGDGPPLLLLTHPANVEQKEERRQCTYDDDTRSMLHSIYNCVLFTATKPLNDNKKEASSSP